MRWYRNQILTSSFSLSGHLFLVMYFLSEFIWVNVERTDLASQKHNLYASSHWKGRSKSTWSEYSARVNQSASLDCRLATNQRLNSVDLRHWGKTNKETKRAGFKTRPPAFGLGQVITRNSNGFAGLSYCSRNCDASYRRTRHCNLPPNKAADLVTLRWRHRHYRTPSRDQHLSRASQRTVYQRDWRKWKYSFSVLSGNPSQKQNTDNSLQKADTYR